MFTILDYLEKSAIEVPDHVFCEDPQESVSFKEFVAKAKAIGTCLAERLSDKRRPIVIWMDNTAQAWTAMIGAVYSGNFYVPLDANMPIERLKSILCTLSPAAVIVDDVCQKKSTELIGQTVYQCKDMLYTPINGDKLAQIRTSMIDTDPVYALFTSGSTGTPKGTIVNHASVIKYTQWYVSEFSIDEKTIFGSQTPFYFSMSVATMFSVIIAGASLVVIPKQYFTFPAKLIDFMNDNKINTIYWVPSAMKIVANYDLLKEKKFKHLKKVLFCGEVMPTKQLNYWRSHMSKDTMFANLYGPTETTDVAAFYVVDREFRDDEALPIGVPCRNCSILVLKEDNTLAGNGEEGELCVRGSFLACGYYNNPEKTKEVFVQNPLNKCYPELIYRTGDIVRYNGHGEIMYLTRKDFQIKHQGYRIELGEIETAISSIDHIHECACVFDEENDQIVLFYTGYELPAKEVLRYISSKLPKYMFPGKQVYLDEMPHNANGKIDRKVLKIMVKELS